MRSINENTVSSKNQLPRSSARFYIGREDAKKRLLIIGNSITRHAPSPEALGWYGDWGMAASSAENDFVHLLTSYLEKDGIDTLTLVRQVATWERGHANPEALDDFKLENEFNADVLVFRLGENIRELENLEEHILELVKFICPGGKIIFTTTVWQSGKINEVIQSVAERLDCKLIDISAIGKEEKYMAIGKFEHRGVAMHPGDEGMRYIADRIYPALKELLL